VGWGGARNHEQGVVTALPQGKKPKEKGSMEIRLQGNRYEFQEKFTTYGGPGEVKEGAREIKRSGQHERRFSCIKRGTREYNRRTNRGKSRQAFRVF